MKKIIHPILGLILSIPLFMSSCNNGKGAGAGMAADPNAVKDYQVITLDSREAEMYSDFPATLEGQQTVEIRPRVDGYIDHIYVDEGAVVKKGQQLFRINGDQFQQQVKSAAANVKIAEANVKSAEMQVNKVRPLVEKDIISKFELESAEYALQSSKASLAQARAQLSNAKTNLSYTYVTSPANGVIGRIPYKVGALVNSTIPEPLTTVANTGRMYAYFSMNEKQILDFTRNTEGASFQAKLRKLPAVTLILSDGSTYSEKGNIETASALINTQTGSSNFRATFPNPVGLLRSGSTGTIRIPASIKRAILVPQKATYEIQGKRFVYLVEADSVKSVPIKVNASASGQSFVVQEGVKAGDKIVIEGIGTLREGSKIKPVPVKADSVYNSL
ncbi:efflux RND transporter periplasmic adaptor subunit [Desertivirga xinjiangensis]|uniref:efflux RND transporter periplasmic adaptor subunit n=1 Tax=Desertivirga xinjiangensis TaxID=539206 RepID=UPI00210D92A7|nr:efflux RND transporter periplasmic adaptor subunit [Pedobacter xinjiangensis]